MMNILQEEGEVDTMSIQEAEEAAMVQDLTLEVCRAVSLAI